MDSAKKEKVTPAQKPVSGAKGIVEDSHAHLTTPKQHTNGEAPWGGQDGKESLF